MASSRRPLQGALISFGRAAALRKARGAAVTEGRRSGTQGGGLDRDHEAHQAAEARSRRELCRNDRRCRRCGRKRRKRRVETDQVGTLTCSLSASIGLVVGSQRNVSCLFRGTSGEPDEPYTGTMTRVGQDVGLTTGSVIIWTVFARQTATRGCSLAPIPGLRQKCPLPRAWARRPRRRIEPHRRAAAAFCPGTD